MTIPGSVPVPRAWPVAASSTAISGRGRRPRTRARRHLRGARWRGIAAAPRDGRTRPAARRRSRPPRPWPGRRRGGRRRRRRGRGGGRRRGHPRPSSPGSSTPREIGAHQRGQAARKWRPRPAGPGANEHDGDAGRIFEARPRPTFGVTAFIDWSRPGRTRAPPGGGSPRPRRSPLARRRRNRQRRHWYPRGSPRSRPACRGVHTARDFDP